MNDEVRKAKIADLPLTDEAQVRLQYLQALQVLIHRGVTSEMVAHLPMASGAQVFILTEMPSHADGEFRGRRAVAVAPDNTLIEGVWMVDADKHEVRVVWADSETIAYPTIAFRMNPTCKPLPKERNA